MSINKTCIEIQRMADKINHIATCLEQRVSQGVHTDDEDLTTELQDIMVLSAEIKRKL